MVQEMLTDMSMKKTANILGQDHMNFICDQCHHTASIDTLDVLIAEDNLHCPICGASSEHLTLKEHKNDN